MLIRGYKVVGKKRFEVFIEDVYRKEGHCLVKIDRCAICKADLRYYSGNRDKRILDLKYPLSLIHEAVGTVVKTGGLDFKNGDKVVLVPNLVKERCKNCVCQRIDLMENYCPEAMFASSNCDGFSKEIISFPMDNLVKIKSGEACYVFTELISVAISALRRIDIGKNSRVAVFGDGILGYIMCSVIRATCDCVVIAVGKHQEKLNMFRMCDENFLIGDYPSFTGKFDIGIECVGGIGMGKAIASIVNTITVGGEILLTGVSEEDVPIDTRKILEKGLSVKGSTRSCVSDFKAAIALFDDERFKNMIAALSLEEIEIAGISDYYRAFERAIKSKELGKDILIFL